MQRERDISAEKQRDKDKYTDTEAWIHEGTDKHREPETEIEKIEIEKDI